MWVSMLWLPINLWYVVPAFVFFRFFDIFKPFGIRKTENLKGGTGVMADDILAGVYANLATQVLFIILKEIR
jgi:phosphatidylglycerophosphatase A